MLIDLNEFFRPRLYLVDAVQTMEGNGPTAGTPKYMGALLSGTNPHKIDLLCDKLIGLEAKNVPTLRAAQERGLTPASAEELEISRNAEEFVCKDFVTVQRGTGTDFGAQKGKLLGAAAKAVLRARPKLKRSRLTTAVWSWSAQPMIPKMYSARSACALPWTTPWSTERSPWKTVTSSRSTSPLPARHMPL